MNIGFVDAARFLAGFNDRGDVFGLSRNLIGFVFSQGARNGCFCGSDNEVGI